MKCQSHFVYQSNYSCGFKIHSLSKKEADRTGGRNYAFCHGYKYMIPVCYRLKRKRMEFTNRISYLFHPINHAIYPIKYVFSFKHFSRKAI